MDTSPISLDALGALAGALDEFRVTAPRDIQTLIDRFVNANARLTLCAGGRGHALLAAGAAESESESDLLTATVGAVMWAADAERGTLGLSVDTLDPDLNPLLEASVAVAVGYLDNVKLQFDLHDRVLVRGAESSVLNCAYPQELYRLQRRDAYRVRPLPHHAPLARVRHTEIAEMQLALRVLDLSIGGCALLMPDDVPPLRPGVVLSRVDIALDRDTRIGVDLCLQHITSIEPEAHGLRLGCEFVNPDGDTLRTLQRFIDQTQKRSRLLGQI